MSITIANLITNLDTYLGDTSTDRISQAERFQALTEATVWLRESLGNDHMVATYDLNYLDSIHYYKVTTAIADLLDAADLRRAEDLHEESFSRRSSREIAEEIGQGSAESAFAIERRNNDCFLVVNHSPIHGAKIITTADNLSDNGTWEVDETNSDATNLTLDNNEFKEGSGSFNFDVDVSQSGNNRATLFNDTLDSIDLSEQEDLGSFLFEAYVPENANFSSFTLYWGTDSSNYWSATATTDINGSAIADGWNTIKIDWSAATKTASPDASDIGYFRIDYNYGAGQGDDTDFRFDNFRVARPEKLTFYYMGWYVGTDTLGTTNRTAFSATTDIPYFSGKYDQYKYAVAHKAASLLFFSPLRMREDALSEERSADAQLDKIKKIIPSSKVPEEKSFKVAGINFNRRRSRR